MPLRRHVQVPVAYLSKDELTQVLAHPDPTTRAGRRDAVMLSVLYDTGARAQELIDLTAHDVRLTTPAQVRLLGKGRKVRVVPLMDATARLLRDHLRENDLDGPERGHLPLFQNRQGGRLSRSGLRYLLHCHVQAARSAVPGFTQKISPHSMRHTKGSGLRLEVRQSRHDVRNQRSIPALKPPGQAPNSRPVYLCREFQSANAANDDSP